MTQPSRSGLVALDWIRIALPLVFAACESESHGSEAKGIDRE